MTGRDPKALDTVLAPVRAIADAVLFEGYVLYPYRVSSSKNRYRWQWGVAGPRGAVDAGVGEEPGMAADLLVQLSGRATLDLRVRCLQVEARQIEPVNGPGPVPRLVVGDETFVSFDEGVERSVDLPGLDVNGLLTKPHHEPVAFAGGQEVSDVRGDPTHQIVRRRWPLRGTVIVSAHRTATKGVVRVRVQIRNTTRWTGGDRQDAARRSLVGTHVMAATSGAFLSALDPPAWAVPAAQSCSQDRLWPVLVGARQVGTLALAAPVILYDAPEVAPESRGEFYDGTEIDELLTLRVMAMTPAEKAEARATDPRSAAVIDRCEAVAAEDLTALHGTRRPVDGGGRMGDAAGASREQVTVEGVAVGPGSAVRLRPTRRADAHDIFYAGRTATVAAVVHDVDGQTHVAVTVDDDPAAELYGSTGRYLYFAPEEVAPLKRPEAAP